MANEKGKKGFQKGSSGNPGGRPKKSAEFRELAQKAGKQILEHLILLATTAERESDQIKSGELVLAYAYGRPPQAIEHTGKDGEALSLRLVDLPPPMSREEWLQHYNKSHAHQES